MHTPKIDSIVDELQSLVKENKRLADNNGRLRKLLTERSLELINTRKQLHAARKAGSETTAGEADEGVCVQALITKQALITENVRRMAAALSQVTQRPIGTLSRFIPFILELSVNGIELNPVHKKTKDQ